MAAQSLFHREILARFSVQGGQDHDEFVGDPNERVGVRDDCVHLGGRRFNVVDAHLGSRNFELDICDVHLGARVVDLWTFGLGGILNDNNLAWRIALTATPAACRLEVAPRGYQILQFFGPEGGPG